MTAAIFAAMALLYIGIQLILHARQGRDLVVSYYRKFPRIYRALFFGDWIANRPSLHIWLIRFGGVWAVIMAMVLLIGVWLAASSKH